MNSRRAYIATATLEVSLLPELDLFLNTDYTFKVSIEPNAPAAAGVEDSLSLQRPLKISVEHPDLIAAESREGISDIEGSEPDWHY